LKGVRGMSFNNGEIGGCEPNIPLTPFKGGTLPFKGGTLPFKGERYPSKENATLQRTGSTFP
jgi:hypothetical protein